MGTYESLTIVIKMHMLMDKLSIRNDLLLNLINYLKVLGRKIFFNYFFGSLNFEY